MDKKVKIGKKYTTTKGLKNKILDKKTKKCYIKSMKYDIYINYRDWELIAESFDPDKLNKDVYDQDRRLSFLMEVWEGDMPLYLNDHSSFNADYLKEISIGIVTPDPVFSIFDKENLTFEQMLDEIQERIPEIVTVTPGDENPYE